MTPRTKSILLLGGTILIGMLLGAVINGMVMRQRLEQIGEMGTPFGFFMLMDNAIQPKDEAQRQAIHAILDEAAPRMMAIMEGARQDMHTLTDSIRAELAPILTEEQLERLEARLSMRGGRSRWMGRPNREGRGDEAWRERWRQRRGAPPFMRPRPGRNNTSPSDSTQ